MKVLITYSNPDCDDNWQKVYVLLYALTFRFHIYPHLKTIKTL